MQGGNPGGAGALVWFRRDVREHDHAALHAALESHRAVHCALVFDTEILDALGSNTDRRVTSIWECVRGLPREIQDAARRKLKVIDAAPDLGALRMSPGNRLGALKGDRKGQWSIRINSQWRICFRWKGRVALGVDPQFWLNLQAQYDIEVIQREQGAQLSEEVHELAV